MTKRNYVLYDLATGIINQQSFFVHDDEGSSEPIAPLGMGVVEATFDWLRAHIDLATGLPITTPLPKPEDTPLLRWEADGDQWRPTETDEAVRLRDNNDTLRAILAEEAGAGRAQRAVLVAMLGGDAPAADDVERLKAAEARCAALRAKLR